MQCDTFDDIPPGACNPLVINELLFSGLRCFLGPVFTGLASQAYGSDVDWGREIQLSPTETLQLRIYPRGVISSGKLLEMRNMTVLIAARRRDQGCASDNVSLAILWHPDRNVDLSSSAFECLRETTQPVAARNLHIVLPSLFNHHDSQWGGAPENKKPTTVWPVLDGANFHALKPSTFSVHRPMRLNAKQHITAVSASAGLSQFIIAGHFANIDVEDVVHRTSEPLSYKKWDELISRHSELMESNRGKPMGYTAIHNAMATCDLLTCEGLIGILGHTFVSGALPDMMHTPNGFPLMIALAARLACYPQRFDMISGTDADQFAARELISLFESSWSPICTGKAGGGRNIYAIDLVMKQAFSEARVAASRNEVTMLVADNMTFWHRAGQRCVTAIFGPRLEDFLPLRNAFGVPDRLVDPLMDARNRVIAHQIPAAEAVVTDDTRQSLNMATTQDKRNVLLTILNSVEHWLRTGSYCDMQLHKKNTVTLHRKRGDGKQKMSKHELNNELTKEVEASIGNMIASGEVKTDAEAHAAAEVMQRGIAAALEPLDDETTVDLTDQPVQVPEDLAEAMGISVEAPVGEDLQQLDRGNLCMDAFAAGVNGVAACMGQGPMVHHQFTMGSFLSSPYAVSQCADCDAEVHLLTATFLASKCGACPRCERPRCIPCTSRAFTSRSRGTYTKGAPPGGIPYCKRCAPRAAAPPETTPQALLKKSRKKRA